MAIKVSGFGFNTSDNARLEVDFGATDEWESIRFLSALAAFVTAFNAGRVVSLEQTSPESVKVVQLAPQAEGVGGGAQVEATPRARKPRATQVEAVGPTGAAEPLAGPPVTESVTPALAPEPAPKAQPATAGSAPPVASASAAVSSPSPAPAAPTQALSGPVPGIPAEPPAEMLAFKSFREVMVWFYIHGVTTQAAVEAACQQYAAVGTIARLMQPNPDPEMSLNKRIERALSVLAKPQG